MPTNQQFSDLIENAWGYCYKATWPVTIVTLYFVIMKNFTSVLTILLLLGILENASALDWMNGPIRDIYYLGVSSDNRMVIAYRGMGSVYIKESRGLREYRDSNWMRKNAKYGNYQCHYAEFPVISFPMTISIVGNTLPHSGRRGTVRKPAVETWTRARIAANGTPISQNMWSNKSWYWT